MTVHAAAPHAPPRGSGAHAAAGPAGRPADWRARSPKPSGHVQASLGRCASGCDEHGSAPCRRSSFSTCLEPAPVRSVTGSEEYKMDNTGSGIRLPRSSSVNVSRRALMRSAAATLAATAVAGIARPAFAQRGPVRTLLKGGVVLSFDPAVGDFEKADVLIEDKRIVAVRPDISADATAIDASRMIVLPGFIDTHHHFYQSALRNVLANGVLADYFRDISGAATNHYRPEDAYIGNLTGALRSLDAGITTITDLSQVSNTPEHSDALIKGLAESGIRAIYAYSRGSGAGAKWPGDVERDRPAGDAGARHRGQQGAMAARAQVRPAHLYP